MFAVASVWLALGVLVTTIFVVVYHALDPAQDTELVVTLLPYTVALSVTFAAGVLWALRKRASAEPGVAGQRLQALAAVILNALTFAALLFWLHGPVDGLLGLGIEGVFLWLCYLGYTRVVLRERE